MGFWNMNLSGRMKSKMFIYIPFELSKNVQLF